MNLIVAVDRNWAIGRDGDQLVYLSEDLKHFKAQNHRVAGGEGLEVLQVLDRKSVV